MFGSRRMAARLELASLDGSTGFTFRGTRVDERTGFAAVGAVGDLNNDGRPDIVVGSPGRAVSRVADVADVQDDAADDTPGSAPTDLPDDAP